MKTRRHSPHTSPLMVRTIKVVAEAQPDALPPIAMDHSKPLGAPSERPCPSSRDMPSQVRRVSGSLAMFSPARSSPLQNGTNGSTHIYPPQNDLFQPSSSPAAANTSPQAENGVTAPWTSAIGHAGTTGKSGRVIERLMAENDRLKREINSLATRNDEYTELLSRKQPKIDTLEAENANLVQMHEMDTSLLSRRDRKIAELKADLEVERRRREEAEGRLRAAERQREEAEESHARRVQQAEDAGRHADVHAGILETSHKQLKAEYQARTSTSRNDLQALMEQRQEDRRNVSKLEVVCEQLRTELERANRTNRDISDLYSEYRAECDRRLEIALEEAGRNDSHTTRLNAEMEEAVHKMRWLMNVRRNLRPLSDDERSTPSPMTRR